MQESKNDKTSNPELVGKLLSLIGDHLIYCPKLKFKSNCPAAGAKHVNSIKETGEFIICSLELLSKVVKDFQSLDLSGSRVDLLRLITSIVLLDDQTQRNKACELINSICKPESSGIIINLIIDVISEIKTSN